MGNNIYNESFCLHRIHLTINWDSSSKVAKGRKHIQENGGLNNEMLSFDHLTLLTRDFHRQPMPANQLLQDGNVINAKDTKITII